MASRFLFHIRRFMQLEAASGVVLGLFAVLAFVVANSQFEQIYRSFLSYQLGPFDVLTWVNDALMAIFFFVVGMEIKHELIDGALASRDRAMLPAVGALGGMVVPALIFLLLCREPEWSRGWGIPMATDIAFAVGLLSLAGRRVPAQLKIFLLALAIVDDLGAILVIALFYSQGVHFLMLAGAGLLAVSIWILAKKNLRHSLLHLVLGVGVWFLVHESGIHATIAGCVLGFLMPHEDSRPEDPTPLERWVGRLHPWVGFGVMPLFAFANSGVVLSGVHWGETLSHPLVNGISLGLLLGKPIGIVGACLLAIALGWARLPDGVSRRHLVAAGAFGGVGFTMALFIARLALSDNHAFDLAKIGIIKGSILSAILGLLIVFCCARGSNQTMPR